MVQPEDDQDDQQETHRLRASQILIVQFTTRYGGFSVDLNVNGKNGIDAAVRTRSILEENAFREEGYEEVGAKAKAKADHDQSAFHPVDHGVASSLVLLVEPFLNRQGMNEVFTGGLGS
ncbi:hypothetical protein B0A53_05747 [Rhodotorula sp. CCFEE 5036]|nr:hypothetical protein B0A53_05747 [Rhodotorula sp. CCFEE 5036]